MNANLDRISKQAERVINAFVEENGYQVIMTTRDIRKLLTDNNVGIHSAWLISDHCYNHYNLGLIEFEQDIHLFEYISNGRYRILGSQYPYNGDILWFTKENHHTIKYRVGVMENGKPILFPKNQYTRFDATR
ncbi:MAG: hypothetical protein ACI4CX_06005 [Candidatus Weimeria sp.]|jgi:hypothetical protein|nr:hypothetical protein [Lachnospiraceae bacterium]